MHNNNHNQPTHADPATSAASTLLGAVDAEVRVLRNVAKRLEAAAAPRFTPFDFLRTDELGLSACIASLLDPGATHGQGAAYLRLFLQALECEPGSAWFDGLDAARVTLEARANGMRRFDIEIVLNGGPGGQRAIVIENKPWAGDQQNQLSDYAQQLASTCVAGGWKLVYLSGGEPSDHAMAPDERQRHQAAGTLALMPFEALAQWLARCAQVTRPIAVRLFIEQMEQFIRKTLCGETDMTEAEAIKGLVTKSRENMSAALLVASSVHTLKNDLLQKGVKAPLQEALYQRGMRLEWNPKMDRQSDWAGFGAQWDAQATAAAAQGYVRFEFENRGLGGLFWGIFRAQPRGQDEVPGALALHQAMTDLFGRGEINTHWFWCSTDLSPLEHLGEAIPKDWQINEMPWLAMHHGTLHKPFVALVDRVHREMAGKPGSALLDGRAAPATPAP